MSLVNNNQGFQNPQPATGADLLSADRYPLLEREAVRQIGIHGARGTGKTCYLASLYGRRINSNLGFSLSLDDNNPQDSLDHLTHAWQALQKGSVPPATAAVNPFRLSFTVTHHGQSWSVRTIDYAGVLVERTPAGAPDLKMEVQQWLCQCDGLLIFVDLSERPQNLLQRLNEVDLLLNRLRKLSPDGQTVPIPIAVVFTKWDCKAKDLHGADFASQQQKLCHYLATHAEFKQFYDQVQLSGERVEVFPVSAFGKYQDNNLPPAHGAQPFGIHEPILWVLQECDWAIFDATEARVTPLLNQRWAEYAKAIATYKSIAKKRLIVRGPVAEKFGQAIRQLRARAALRFSRLAACTLITSVLLTLSGMFGWDTYRYHAVLKALNDTGYDLEEKEKAARNYTKTANPLAQWLGRRQHIEKLLADLRKRWHDDDYEALRTYYDAYKEDETKQQEIVTCADQFLRRWPDSPNRSEVETWRRNAYAWVLKQHERKAWEALVQFLTQHDKDSQAEQRINGIEMFLREYPESNYKEHALSSKRAAEDAHKRWQQYQTLLSEWPQIKEECENLTNGGNSDAAVSKCVGFRVKCQQFEHSIRSSPTYKEYSDELARLLDEIDKTGDRCQWRGVELYAARNPSNYEQIIEKAKAYKESKIFATKYYDKAADRLIEKATESWDSTLYNDFRKAANHAAGLTVVTNNMSQKTVAFEAAAKLAQEYLDSNCPRKKHKSTVKNWLQWFEGINQPALAVSVTIVQAVLAQNAETIREPFNGAPDVEITLGINTEASQNQQWVTPTVNDSFNPKYNMQCENVMISWNDSNAKLTLMLTDYDVSYHDKLEITFEGPDVIFLLDNWIWVQDGPGRHFIHLSCEELRPPSLPEYGDNPL